jgi:hypothetical protein
LFYAFLALIRKAEGPVLRWARSDREFEMVGGQDLPDFATPIVISDKRGKAYWTVSIPTQANFPLTSLEYSDICAKCQEVSGRVNTLRSYSHGFHQISLVTATRGNDEYFVDVAEAKSLGLLPTDARGSPKDGAASTRMKSQPDRMAENSVCKSSLTFVLESEDAGIGRTLMLMWASYAWAKAHGRTFFIEDTTWAYGQYQEIFAALPPAACRQPPKHEILPCPKQARHLALTADTAASILDLELEGDQESDRKPRRKLFDLVRQGYTDLFRLNAEDASYVGSRVQELKDKTLVPKSKGRQDGMIVGLHVRHGDRHPFDYQYRRSYIPINHYTDKAHEMLDSRLNITGPRADERVGARTKSLLIVASDDPLVYDLEELSRTVRAQEQIKLASKAAIQQANPDRHVMHKFIDETFGWDGGFFAPMFWNLGTAGVHRNAGSELKRSAPAEETTRLRSLMGRAYMIDLAVLAGASDFVVCTVSAMGCRLLAVMMGWDSAFTNGRWINIDGEYGWMAI